MTTTQAQGQPAKTSKYAEKVAAQRAAAVAEIGGTTSSEPSHYQPRGYYKPRNGYQPRGYYQPHNGYQPRNTYNNKVRKPKLDMAALAARFSDHTVRLASIVKNNSEIRRFTALGILNYLLQKGEISGDSRYVQFKWDKFGVKSDGIMREYRYTEPFFLNALVASFTSFAASAQNVIDKFCVIELNENIEKATDAEEVANIIESNKSIETDAPFEVNNDDEE